MKFLSNERLFGILLLVGMYFPTSAGGSADALAIRGLLVVSAIVLCILVWRVGIDERMFLWFSGPIVIWLGLCTVIGLFSPGLTLTLAPSVPYCFLGLVLLTQVGKLRSVDLTTVLAVISVVNLSLAVSMLTVESVADFMVKYYNDFTDETIAGMIAAYKPVLTFTTHSLAGVFIYLLFWLNFRTYQKTGKRLHLVLAILHIGICIFLTSVTSLGLAALAIAEMAWSFRKTAILLAVGAFALFPVSLKEGVSDGLSTYIWFREGGGFLSRYTANGILTNVFLYIRNHPFQPIGLLFSNNLFAEGARTDSGPLMYFLRGSLPLVLLIYGGFFVFLRRNLSDKWDCYRIFFLVLAAEVGIVVLLYPRSFLLIPAFVIYLNSLPTESPARASGLEALPVPS